MSESAVELAFDGRALRKGLSLKLALCDLSLQVRPSEMAALMGASGSGKSALLRILTGVHCADLHGVSSVHLAGRHALQASHQNPIIRNSLSKESQPLHKDSRNYP
jgi:ABC-type sulfate/molybdate transport systems ATPase subunit